jgi:ComF family protein
VEARPGKRGLFADAFGLAADLIWPPRSLLSEAIVTRPGAIEPDLWGRLVFLSAPCCFRCGFPFENEAGEEAVCGSCAADPPSFHRARAALAYDDLSRNLALELKHAGRRDGLPVFAAWMAHAAGPLGAEADLIVPAPLHWTRLASRRFNQAAWLAQALARRCGKPLSYAALARVKRSPSQAGLNPDQRRRNVAGAFRVPKSSRKLVAGKAILLVDDVYTTGATAEACARALLRAGAARADVVTLARVVRPADGLV